MPPNRAQFHFQQGLNLIQKEDYQKASTYFKEAILEEPHFHEALYNLACCHAMIGDKDNALIYLSRAINLNMHCIDWAKEDREFNSVKSDPLFIKLVNPEDDINVAGAEGFTPTVFPEVSEEQAGAAEGEESLEERELSEDTTQNEEMPNLTDEKEIIEDLPPCTNCGGLLHSEKRTRSSPKQLSAILVGGLLLLFVGFMYFTILTIVGIGVIVYGLYSLTRIDTIWVCNSCSSAGEECGQPKETMTSKQVDKLDDLTVKKKK